MILKITNGLNGYPRFGWVDIIRFQQTSMSYMRNVCTLSHCEILSSFVRFSTNDGVIFVPSMCETILIGDLYHVFKRLI